MIPLVGAEAGGILGRDDHLVADAALLHPLAEPGLRFFILVVVRAGWVLEQQLGL